MKKSAAIALAVLVSGLVSIVVVAQPAGTGGLRYVNHSVAFYGSGTTGSALDLRHDCSAGNVLKWNSGSSFWECDPDLGLTNAGSGLTSTSGTVDVKTTTGSMIQVLADSIGLDPTGCSVGYVPTWQGSATGWQCLAGGSGGGGGGSAAFVSIAQAATTGTPNLTTLGTSDWIVFSSNTPSNSAAQMWRKLTGGRQIERPVWMNTVMSNIATQARTQAVTWTASDNLSQGSAGTGFVTTELAFSAAGTNFGFVTSAPSSITARTFTIYVANFNESDPVTCSAVLADHEYAQQNVSFTMSGIDNRTITVVYNSQQATRINVWCFITSGTNTNLGWLAMWLA